MKTQPNNNPPEMNELPDALDALVQKAGYTNLSAYLNFCTSRKLPFITDSWGGIEGRTHFELHHLGQTIQITCEENHIVVYGFVNISQEAVNLHHITA